VRENALEPNIRGEIKAIARYSVLDAVAGDPQRSPV
jgi:hypothetical protein